MWTCTFIPVVRRAVPVLLVVRLVVLVGGRAGGAAAGARAALAARAELLADAARCNTADRSHSPPSPHLNCNLSSPTGNLFY